MGLSLPLPWLPAKNGTESDNRSHAVLRAQFNKPAADTIVQMDRRPVMH